MVPEAAEDDVAAAFRLRKCDGRKKSRSEPSMVLRIVFSET